MNGLLEWILFLALSLVAIATAAGMLITMSMYRAGLALMASLVALAGLFLLLDADLLAAIQVMMNVGGMLVMILFMVMIMMDPGGEMMWGMKRDMHIKGLGAFSMTMPRGKAPVEAGEQGADAHQIQTWTCPMHSEVSQDHPGTCPKCGMQLASKAEKAQKQDSSEEQSAQSMSSHSMMDHSMMNMPAKEGEADEQNAGEEQRMQSMSSHDMMDHSSMDMSRMSESQNYQMMVDMAMSTAQLPWALVLGALSAILLIVLVVVTPWPVAHISPTQDAVSMVGDLLLSRYMIGFEGAAFLILAGIAGAVILAKRERPPMHPQETDMTERVDTDASSMSMTYTCPMHSDIRQNQPGNCPRCGMQLVPETETNAAMQTDTQGGRV